MDVKVRPRLTSDSSGRRDAGEDRNEQSGIGLHDEIRLIGKKKTVYIRPAWCR